MEVITAKRSVGEVAMGARGAAVTNTTCTINNGSC